VNSQHVKLTEEYDRQEGGRNGLQQIRRERESERVGEKWNLQRLEMAIGKMQHVTNFITINQ
jgi:hypothetical protein